MDKLGVINHALLKVGLPLAAAVNDCDWNASVVFDISAEQALRAHPWSFAQAYASLGMSGTSPVFGWNYAYGLPEDCLRVIDVHAQHDLRSPKARYALQGRKVLTNVSPCYARYICRLLEPEAWPPDFTDAVACRIACEIAALSAEKMSLVPQLMQLYQLSLNQAIASDAREETERVPLNDSLYADRRMGN